MRDITLRIDDQTVTVPEGATVLEAATSVQIEIPTLCWMPRSSPWASCLVCAVQIGESSFPVAPPGWSTG